MKSFIKSYGIQFVISVLLGVLFIVLVKPDQISKQKVSVDDYDLEVASALRFEQFDSAYFILKPTVEESSIANFKFKNDERLRVSIGILPWSEYKEQGLEYDLNKNGKKIKHLIVDANNNEDFYLTVNSGDVIQFNCQNLKDETGVQGCITIEKVQFAELIGYYVFALCISLLCFLFIRFSSLREMVFPLVFYLLLLSTETIGEQKFEFESLFISTLAFLAYGFLIITLGYFNKHWYQKIPTLLVHLFFFLVSIVPLAFLAYRVVFEIQLGRPQMLAIYQSNQSEAWEFLQTHISLEIVIGLLVFLILFVWSIWPGRQKRSTSKLGLTVLIAICTFLIAVLSNNWRYTRTFIELYASYNQYTEEVKLFQEAMQKFKTNAVPIQANKEEKGETYVVIIGESLNRNHMSLYGYFRETTPLLDSLYEAGELIRFNQAISHHTHTVPVLELALTTANQTNKEKAWQATQLIPILNAAGFKTTWISNQVRYGAWDNIVSVIGESCTNHQFLNKTIGTTVRSNHYDEVVLDQVIEQASAQTNDNQVIFVHLLGNHGNYDERYPERFDKYNKNQGKFDKGEMGDLKGCYINEYDNSVLYNDYVVGNLIKGVVQNTSGPTAIMYFADHSENMVNWLGHEIGKYKHEMSEIPFLVSVNEEFKRVYPGKYEDIKMSSEKAFTNDILDQMILDLTNVRTDLRYDSLSVFNEAFNAEEDELTVKYGEIRYTSPENKHYWEKKNAEKLDKQRFLPHRINTKFMFAEAIRTGFNGVEIDVVVQEVNGSIQLEIGHGEEELMSGNYFQELLAWKGADSLKKIWLDVKNLDEENMEGLLKHLDSLDEVYAIKQRLIVESMSTYEEFKILANAGYSTSYYLPTNVINDPKDKQLRIAKNIAAQIKKQGVSAVSFDSKLLPFVNAYLVSRIDSEIVFHVWDIHKTVDDAELLPKLESEDYYVNERIKTILLRLNSDFYL